MRVAITLSISTLLAACGCSPTEPAKPTPQLPAAVPYDGPELTASIETTESAPPKYTLVVDVNCPTGGYALRSDGLSAISGGREARFVLTSPAADELVPQAFERHKATLDLGSERTPVRVLVAQRRRRDPKAAEQPFQLATTVTPQ